MSPNQLMHRAIELAHANLGNVSPRPSVGALIVKNNKLIAESVTQENGNHAEYEAIHKASDCTNATLVVTLEPCVTHKPSCADIIIKSGIKKVIIGTLDMNPLIHGKGIKKLKAAGINVTLLNLPEARKVHEFFFHWIITKKPFVTIKAALTKNGFMTWGDGKRKKITNEEADKHDHLLRKQHDTILVGVNTIIKDDPQLTNRSGFGKHPLKVILDSELKTPIDAKIFDEGKTIIYCIIKPNKKYPSCCEIVRVKEKQNQVDIDEVLSDLGNRNITSLLVEGGSTVIASFINQKKANKCIFFVAEKEVKAGQSFFPLLKERLKLKDISAQKQGNAIAIEGYF